ncbi:MAG: TOBE domain-containing protein [Nesterenkonia sp.]|uniref:TOBE domain-containing protein n=1 Tax=Nesterenkonia marinintestina TaxID=2979865 RepID=UPI0021BFAD03|nr:TOBE domain-containing protein [Nesterenkonia sp. GX14115]MDO5492222.1 TOBE domain-containing protein [Nesterenkonia sp.]
MRHFRVAQAAAFLGVSDDTLRRWIGAGRLSSTVDASGRTVVEGAELAALVRESAASPEDPAAHPSSARNRFVGLVTRVTVDGVMAQVDIQAGPHRVVSLLSAEAVEELGLAPGELATATVKATHVVVETPR